MRLLRTIKFLLKPLLKNALRKPPRLSISNCPRPAPMNYCNFFVAKTLFQTLYCELNFQLRHPVFGRDKHLEEFLVHKNAPIRAKIKKGFLTGVKESLEMRKTSTIRDPDDFFQKEKEWAMAYGTQIKEVCDRFNGLSSAKMRLSNQVILKEQ